MHLARTRLLYGEWLRRENRGLDAREQLRAAHDTFSGIGADAFAERARRAERVGLWVDPDRPVGTLSGGQAARASLAAVLASRYDVLLLDEPTNDLDRAGRALMTDFVRSHAGPVLVASHDRAFLDDVATRVVETDLPQQQVAHYTGNYSDYVAQRSLAREQSADAYERYAEERDDLLAQAGQRREWAEQNGGRSRSAVRPTNTSEREEAGPRRQAAPPRAHASSGPPSGWAPVSQPRKEWRLRYELCRAGSLRRGGGHPRPGRGPSRRLRARTG